MADRWRRPHTWDGTWAGKILDIIYGHYKKALDLLPLEDKTELAPRLLDAGVCFGFADPVTNIIANTLSFGEPAPDGSIKRRKRKRKPKTNASEEARSREEVLSRIVAGDGPSPPEARTVAERSLEGLVSFLTSYFRYLPNWDALRYLSLARADLLVAVSLIQKDHCYRYKDQFRICSPAVKTSLKCAAWSARQPNFDGFLAGCFALVPRINKITQTLSAEGRCRLTAHDISFLSQLLANPPKLKRSDKPMDLVAKRFHDPEPKIAASIEDVPGELTESLRGVLMDRVHEHYLKAVSRFPMKDLQTHHHRGLLKAGYCFGPFDPVSNIIVNTVWYGTAFPPSEEFGVDMICTLRHVESRSANGLMAFVRSCSPVISERKAMVYLLKCNLDVCEAIQMAKQEGCDVSICDDNGYKAAAKAAYHPNPEAYCEFVVQSLPALRSTVRSLLRPSHMLAPSEILHLSTLLSFSSVESLEPIIHLTEDALNQITNYKQDFLTQQSFVRGKVEAALRNYEQSKGCYYDLGVICGVNDRVGKVTGIFDTKFQYTHANFWASQDNGTSTLFFAEFSNDEDSNYEPICYPVCGLPTQVRCCYCEYQGIRIVHPIGSWWEGVNGFEKIACGEQYFTNTEIVGRWKLIDNRVGIFVQDYVYLDPAHDAKLIQAVNKAERVRNIDMDAEMRRRKSEPAAGH
ncbi:hypothetical protein SEVIR_1G072000v4 [Setaria viridis]|uniref:Uncharacterized protein n=1 Tax=Setaria viridis TaxID=4556 RepID=A0A4U6W7G1_SETVI|nr:uncharacterized protein LOC117838250 [Setaria viridis]TKW37795.1 hypothetical protein SEVIR_1G072000v2 [Setaria viridis]TKW37796.1 hypothetical protein SEVIR_1G072000v2 [Setaria viridis]